MFLDEKIAFLNLFRNVLANDRERALKVIGDAHISVVAMSTQSLQLNNLAKVRLAFFAALKSDVLQFYATTPGEGVLELEGDVRAVDWYLKGMLNAMSQEQTARLRNEMQEIVSNC